MFRWVITSCLLAGIAVAKLPPARDAPEPVPFGEKLQPVPLNDDDADRTLVIWESQALAIGSHRYTSPNFGPGNFYPHNRDIRKRRTGVDGQVISISCSSFDVEYQRDCNFDYLQINGQKYCGNVQIPTITSRELELVFHTDGSIHRPGFDCQIVVRRCQCGVGLQSSRIVGGSDAAAGQVPWQARLQRIGSSSTLCGGIIITKRYVLTAAHCTWLLQTWQFEVLLGDLRTDTADSGEQRYPVEEFVVHPRYSYLTSAWDFSLVKVNRVIVFSDTISTVCLPTAGENYVGVTATASGYGRVGADAPQSTTLKLVELPVWRQSDCKTVYGSSKIKSSMICAGGYPEGGKSICRADSGGPLVTEVSSRWRLIGVTSFSRPCARAGTPDVFARVTKALPWIERQTADEEYCSDTA